MHFIYACHVWFWLLRFGYPKYQKILLDLKNLYLIFGFFDFFIYNKNFGLHQVYIISIFWVRFGYADIY